jgi:hypothetical protein
MGVWECLFGQLILLSVLSQKIAYWEL